MFADTVNTSLLMADCSKFWAVGEEFKSKVQKKSDTQSAIHIQQQDKTGQKQL